MKSRHVILSRPFLDDLFQHYVWIAEAADFETADRYGERLQAYWRTFDLAAERGTARDDLLPGLRYIGFETSAVLTFRVTPDRVEFLRAYFGGQDWEAPFREED